MSKLLFDLSVSKKGQWLSAFRFGAYLFILAIMSFLFCGWKRHRAVWDTIFAETFRLISCDFFTKSFRSWTVISYRFFSVSFSEALIHFGLISFRFVFTEIDYTSIQVARNTNFAETLNEAFCFFPVAISSSKMSYRFGFIFSNPNFASFGFGRISVKSFVASFLS